MKRTGCVAAIVICIFSWSKAQTPADSKLIYPIIPNTGGVVPLPHAAEQPRNGSKVVFDVTVDAKPGEINKGVERIARLLNLYGAAKKKSTDIKVTVVFHGEATKTILMDEVYKAKFGTANNPNLITLNKLREAGVEIFVCGQALHYKNFSESSVAKGISIASAALTVVINRQNEGYAYIPVHQ